VGQIGATVSGYRENKWVTIRVKRKGRCNRCRGSIPKATYARYNPAFGSIIHTNCRPPETR
jgi:hypothetical protein